MTTIQVEKIFETVHISIWFILDILFFSIILHFLLFLHFSACATLKIYSTSPSYMFVDFNTLLLVVYFYTSGVLHVPAISFHCLIIF